MNLSKTNDPEKGEGLAESNIEEPDAKESKQIDFYGKGTGMSY